MFPWSLGSSTLCSSGFVDNVIFLPARRYASAVSSYGFVSVSLSVSLCHKSVFYRNGWTVELVLACRLLSSYLAHGISVVEIVL